MLAIFFGIGASCARDQADPINGKDSPSTMFQQYQSRLLAEFTEDGWVVARHADNAPHDQGDSLLFTSLALAAVDCDLLEPLVQALEQAQAAYGGYLVRFRPLPPEYVEKDSEVSRDGVTGFLLAVQLAGARCGNVHSRLEALRTRLYETVGSQATLYPGALHAYITPPFRVFWKVANGKTVNEIERQIYVAGARLTTSNLISKQEACYPVHIETLQHIIMERQGYGLSAEEKAGWCQLTDGRGLLLTDWYCDRNQDQINYFLANPENTPRIYTHQRCDYESPDLKDKRSPRVDFLILDRLYRDGSSL